LRRLNGQSQAYALQELLGDNRDAEVYQNGRYVTLRLTAAMYHHFHAPHDCRVELVTYVSGDTWNVIPFALKQIERLSCKNERAVIRIRLSGSNHLITLVPVAAIPVASIRLTFLDTRLGLRHGGPRTFACSVPLLKGEVCGWFQHGSTTILLAPDGFALCGTVREGSIIRVGQPLMRLPHAPWATGELALPWQRKHFRRCHQHRWKRSEFA
jgi:phosphatidylserine decarboxylase